MMTRVAAALAAAAVDAAIAALVLSVGLGRSTKNYKYGIAPGNAAYAGRIISVFD